MHLPSRGLSRKKVKAVYTSHCKKKIEKGESSVATCRLKDFVKEVKLGVSVLKIR